MSKKHNINIDYWKFQASMFIDFEKQIRKLLHDKFLIYVSIFNVGKP